MNQTNTPLQSFSRPVSVIIPTCNGKHLLAKHLPEVLKTLRHDDELVIADDASSDGTTSWLINGFKLQKQMKAGVKGELYQGFVTLGNKRITLTVIRHEQNIRFAASCNRAVKIAHRELIFLLNNDVSPNRNVLSILVPYFADPDVFAVGCLEYEGDTTTAPQAGKNKLWFAKGLYQHQKADSFESGKTAWVSGGSGMFDKQKWLFLGGFDEAYTPAYWEDVDLSFRARLHGWRVLFESQAVVFHQHESTNSVELGQTLMMEASWKNGLYFTKKHARGWQKLAFYLFKLYWQRKWKQKKQQAAT